MSKHSRFNKEPKRIELWDGVNSKELLIQELTRENERLKKEIAELREKAGNAILKSSDKEEEEIITDVGGPNV